MNTDWTQAYGNTVLENGESITSVYPFCSQFLGDLFEQLVSWAEDQSEVYDSPVVSMQLPTCT